MVTPRTPVNRKKLGLYGGHVTQLVQFFITSTNAWVVFSSGDVTDVECVLTEKQIGTLALETISQRWAIPVRTANQGTLRTLLCSAVDAQFAQFCAAANGPFSEECSLLQPLAGQQCNVTTSVSVAGLGILTLINVVCLVIFMWLDAALEFHDHEDEYDAHEIKCTSLPPALRRHRFTLALVPTVAMPALAICLIRSSAAMGGCLFNDASLMAFALVLIWAVVTIVAVRSYERLRERFDDERVSMRVDKAADDADDQSEFESA